MPDGRLGTKGILANVETYRPLVTLRWLDGRLAGWSASARRGFDELQRLIREHVPACYKYSAHEPAENSLTSTWDWLTSHTGGCEASEAAGDASQVGSVRSAEATTAKWKKATGPASR